MLNQANEDMPSQVTEMIPSQVNEDKAGQANEEISTRANQEIANSSTMQLQNPQKKSRTCKVCQQLGHKNATCPFGIEQWIKKNLSYI